MNDRLTWDDRALCWLVWGFAFLLPFSIAAAETLAFLAVAVWLYGAVRRRRWGFVRSAYFWPTACFAVIALLSSFWGLRPEISLPKCHRLWLLGLIFILPEAFGPDRPSGWRNALWALGLFVAGTTLLGLFDVCRVIWLVHRGVALFDTGNMRDPQYYLCALCLLMAAWTNPEWTRQKPRLVPALLLTAAGLVLHFKRGAWFSFVLAAGLMGLIGRRYRTVLAVFLCAVALLAVPQVRLRLQALSSESSRRAGGRWELWTRVAPEMIRQYPQGIGLCGTKHEDFLKHTLNIQPKLNHLHNNLLQVALETGLAGLAVWLWWMGTVFWVSLGAYHGLRQRDPAAAWVALGIFGAFSGLMINGLVEYNFGDAEILMLLCFLMGLSAVVHARLRGGKPAS